MRRVVIQAMLVVCAAVLLLGGAMVGLHMQPSPPTTQEADAFSHVYTTATSTSGQVASIRDVIIHSPYLPPPHSTATNTSEGGSSGREAVVVYDGRCEYAGSSNVDSISKGGGLISEAQYRKGVEAYTTKESCTRSIGGLGDSMRYKEPRSIAHASGSHQHSFPLSAMGSWLIQPPTTDGEPIRHWIPHNFTDPHWRRFSSQDARKCLNGTRIVFVGNSNTRTLYTALEALLRDTPMMSRLGAKQLCDNRQSNHSCWARIEGGGGDGPSSKTSTQLHYVSYVKDLYDIELEDRVANPFGFGKKGIRSQQNHHASQILFFNTGLNVIQGQHDPQWMPEHKKNAPKLEEFLTRFLHQSSTTTSSPARMPYFVWHPTTRLCPHQAHFKRYKYKPKVWRGRTLEQTNEAAAVSNSLIRPVVDRLRIASIEKGNVHQATRSSSSLAGGGNSRVHIIEGDEMLLAPEVLPAEGQPIAPTTTLGESSSSPLLSSRGATGTGGSTYPNHLCPLYDDPLHHRFYDREVIQVFLNRYCNS